MGDPQLIFDENGRPAFVVIPWREYERLAADAEASLSDEALYDRAEAEGGETFPIELADRLLAGENPVMVYRTYRGMSRKALAEAAGVSAARLARIEGGEHADSPGVLRAIANALGVDAGDLARGS